MRNNKVTASYRYRCGLSPGIRGVIWVGGGHLGEEGDLGNEAEAQLIGAWRNEAIPDYVPRLFDSSLVKCLFAAGDSGRPAVLEILPPTPISVRNT